MEDLWKIRRRKQMTVAQLSAKAGVPARLIREYESGRKTIPMDILEKLARALFVDVLDIKPLSDPIDSEPESAPARESAEQKSRPPEGLRTTRPSRPAPRSALPARETQISHLLLLAERLEWSRPELEKEVGKPLESLSRREASYWLKRLQEEIVANRPRKPKKRRPYLPESVDTFELQYLQTQQAEGTTLAFSLFNGTTVEGRVIGFGPYSITIRTNDGEMTLNKLAIAYYRQVAKDN